MSVDHPESLGRWCGPYIAGFVGMQLSFVDQIIFLD